MPDGISQRVDKRCLFMVLNNQITNVKFILLNVKQILQNAPTIALDLLELNKFAIAMRTMSF
jgi:hypothetical protein